MRITDKTENTMRILTTFIALSICTHLFAQSKSEYGFADKSIPELAQFEYYLGEWTSEMEMKQEDGTFKKLDITATIKGKFLDDHRTYQSQFTTPTGFFSTDIRSFNITTKEWDALFLNAQAQRWHKFSSKMVDGKMTTIVKGGYSGKEDFDLKVVDTVVSDSHYLKNVYNSADGMKTWELVYKIDVKKVK
ncbi:hypothetical protein [Fulvivirga lutimaris]|uniref:hypothetical protein n=1 Tax=Fulvivirga lutimaris TaxID=1819566 RepID=UPI0012BC95B8|nr:hypothetical protein [Fulvivirga lutimaris]MTI41315.1 hypothetical protein [Fulvivirga lutimaris]